MKLVFLSLHVKVNRNTLKKLGENRFSDDFEGMFEKKYPTLFEQIAHLCLLC